MDLQCNSSSSNRGLLGVHKPTAGYLRGFWDCDSEISATESISNRNLNGIKHTLIKRNNWANNDRAWYLKVFGLVLFISHTQGHMKELLVSFCVTFHGISTLYEKRTCWMTQNGILGTNLSHISISSLFPLRLAWQLSGIPTQNTLLLLVWSQTVKSILATKKHK